MRKPTFGRDAFKRSARKLKAKKSQSMTGLSLEAAKKARTKKHWAKYKNKRRPASHTVEKEGKLVLPKTKYLRLKISKIKTRPDQIADPNVASSVAESWVAVPQIHPVIVRKLGEGKYELVWGADVIAAAAAAELSVIECQIFKGTKEEARLVQVAEALFRKELTALEQAEHWVEWAEGVLKAKGLFSGQPVAKRGRPEGKLLKAAQLLPAYGERTLAARKKMLERAYKIAGLPSDVKEAIKKAGLDNNGSALLAIASSGREAEAQHRKLNKIVEKISDLAELESRRYNPTEILTRAATRRRETGMLRRTTTAATTRGRMMATITMATTIAAKVMVVRKRRWTQICKSSASSGRNTAASNCGHIHRAARVRSSSIGSPVGPAVPRATSRPTY